MLIRSVRLNGFFGITDAVELPAAGTLMVTAKNGAGKTARLLEAPAWAGWGRTLRSTPPSPPGSSFAEVTLATDKVEVVRSTRKSSRLTWNHLGRAPTVYETVTKADEALERVLGDQTTWRRTHVFSSSDAALFSAATDGERKRLLERLIGIDIFDEAQRLVAQSNAIRLATLNQLRSELTLVENRILETKKHALDLKELASGPEVDAESGREELFTLASSRAEHQRVYQDTMTEITRSRTTVDLTRKQQVQHKDGLCYACGQGIPPDVLNKQKEDLEKAIENARSVEERERVAMQEAAQAIGRIDARMAELQDLISRNSGRSMAAEKLAILKARYEKDKQRLDDIRFDLEVLGEDEHVLNHASRVLGLKGIRPRVLARALVSLEDLANLYLSWLNSPSKLRLLSSSEQANGKPSDKITIQIDGYGGGHGYSAASGGERRRVDLSLLLALASLSGSKGTLIFDEAFDALDQEGVESACELLTRIAETRPVVIITHNPALVQSLKGPHLSLGPR